MNLEKVELGMLGTCRKASFSLLFSGCNFDAVYGSFNCYRNYFTQVTVSKDDTVVLDGAGDKKAIEERCELVRCLFLCSILLIFSILL